MIATGGITRGQGPGGALRGRGGDWRQDAIAGVFNETCMITYDNDRRHFPLWALGLYESRRRGPWAARRELGRP